MTEGPHAATGSARTEDALRILEIEIFGRGGLTHYVDNLSRALVARGHRVTVVTALDYELEGEALPPGMRVERLVARAARRYAGRRGLFANVLRKAEAIVDAFRVARYAARSDAQVVHLHCTNVIATLYLVLLRLRGLCVVHTAHVVTPHEPMPLERPLYRFQHSLPHLTIAHSRFDRERLVTELRCPAARVRVVPHGEYGFFEQNGAGADAVEVRRELGIAAEAPVALFFGYIREYKGLDVLFDCWPAVHAALPAARLLVAGDPVQLTPERRDQLASEADRLDVVRRFGYVPFAEVARYVAAADVLVMPYRRISQSGALFLALALGLPVVATRVGGLPEMLEDGRDALFVEPEDPDALADALIRVLGDADLRRLLAAGGREVAARHSWPSIAERTEEAFRRLRGPRA